MIKGLRRLETGALVFITLVTLGVLLRLMFLDSDPAYGLWMGYLTDEGRWTELARETVLFGSPSLDGPVAPIHLIIAPAYQAITTVFFAIMGVGFTSARLVSALSGIALLISAVIFLRGRLSTEGLLVTVLVLAIQPDLLSLSRVAVPETSAMLFEFLAFALLLSKPWSNKRAFGAGLLTAIALALKATIAPFVPILAAAAVVVHRADDTKSGLRRIGAYTAGLVIPALVGLTAAVYFMRLGNVPQHGLPLATIAGFVQVKSLYAALSTLFFANYAPALHALLLPAWVIAGILLAVGRTPSSPARVIYLGSATWIMGWLLTASTLLYFPERYVFHVLVPLAINVGAGLTLLQTVGRKRILNSVSGNRGVKRAILAAWFALPSAVLFSPNVLTFVRFEGLDPEKFRYQFAVTLLLLLVFAVVLVRVSKRESVLLGAMVFPLVFAPLWFIGVHVGVSAGGFWAYGTSDTVGRSALLILSAAATVLICRDVRRSGATFRYHYAYPLLLASLWLAQITPRFIAPTYTILGSSTALAELVDESVLVGTGSASAIFLGNDLQYTEDLDVTPPPEVLAWTLRPPAPALVDAYSLVEEYELNLGDPPPNSSIPMPQSLKIYRRER